MGGVCDKYVLTSEANSLTSETSHQMISRQIDKVFGRYHHYSASYLWLHSVRSTITSTSTPSKHIAISRHVIDFDELNQKYGKRVHPPESIGRKVSQSVKKCSKSCSPFGFFLRLFPIINWIKSYSIKEYLINDVIAGFTILILHIPQGMAYGMLSGLSAINGLYVSFFPVLIYSLMGTSRHLSIGK
ncbi:unnamed protein product [Oppiella nova]|uniref:SLC26A/SulP transporter domain-containing protein n=1 Tax=Oppiella nova TaxID=334625 RepID=A0A7R9QDP4_9ACAR|nr:unnamed protein product [Oppiella nova]CAG2163250.1 unnamed protein product [Oppiella nova]